MVTLEDKAPAAVLMSLEEFTSWEETLHLLRSPANAARLKAAVDELDTTGGKERKLVE